MNNAKTVKIDGNLLLSEIKNAGYNRQQMSDLIGKEKSYISSSIRSGIMPEKVEMLICAILQKPAGYFIQAEPAVVTKSTEPDVVPVAIQRINDELVALRELMELTLKKVADISGKQVADGGYIRTISRGVDKLNEDIVGITKTEVQRAADYIEQCLVNGDARAQEIMEGADARCISRAELLKAKEQLHIRVYTTGQGAAKKTYWSR